ncbi:MAG: sigma-70 family RNA polymerase sigma factor [Saprospiraceae bacterium]|nr:sigma-70 family RNA polymerase sigma factor [Saprospiraceae bacterium]
MADTTTKDGYKNEDGGLNLLKVVSDFLTAPFHTKAKESSLELFEGLQQGNKVAYLTLIRRVLSSAKKIARSIGLPNEDAEDLTYEGVFSLIEKIQKGQYEYQGNDPASYVIKGISQKMISRKRTERRRAEKHQDPHFLSIWSENTGTEAFDEQENSAKTRRLAQNALDHLDPKCRLLITLHTINNIPDKEVIDRQLSPYRTVDALKNKRCACMKKLRELINRDNATLPEDL